MEPRAVAKDYCADHHVVNGKEEKDDEEDSGQNQRKISQRNITRSCSVTSGHLVTCYTTYHTTVQQANRLTGCVTAVGLIDGVPRRFSARCPPDI